VAVTHFNTQTATQANASSVTANRPTGTSTGDLLLAVFTSNNQNCTPPAGWTELNDSEIDTFRNQIFYKVATASEPTSYTFTVPSAASPLVLTISGLRGLDASNLIDIEPVAVASAGQSEPYSTPSVSGGTVGHLLYLRTVRFAGSTPATFTATGVTEITDVGVFSGGSVCYSIGLYFASSDYTSSGSKPGLAITSSQTESHNVAVTWAFKTDGLTATMDATIPMVPSVSMSGSPEIPGDLDADLPLPVIDGEIFNGEYDGTLDVQVPITVSMAGLGASAGSLDVTILPVVQIGGETRRFADNVVEIEREERWFIITQEGYELGTRAAVRDLRIRIDLPMPTALFSGDVSPLGATTSADVVASPSVVASTLSAASPSASVVANNATVIFGTRFTAGSASATSTAYQPMVSIKPAPEEVAISVEALSTVTSDPVFAQAEHVSVTCHN